MHFFKFILVTQSPSRVSWLKSICFFSLSVKLSRSLTDSSQSSRYVKNLFSKNCIKSCFFNTWYIIWYNLPLVIHHHHFCMAVRFSISACICKVGYTRQKVVTYRILGNFRVAKFSRFFSNLFHEILGGVAHY